jgi:two-component system sensor histidine kinase UhpB
MNNPDKQVAKSAPNKLGASLSQLLIVVLSLIVLIGAAAIIQNERLTIQLDMQQRLQMLLLILKADSASLQTTIVNEHNNLPLVALLASQQAMSIQISNVLNGQSVLTVAADNDSSIQADWLEAMLSVKPLSWDKQLILPMFSPAVQQQLVLQVNPRYNHALVRQRLQIFLALMFTMIAFIGAATLNMLSSLKRALRRVQDSIFNIQRGNYSTRLSAFPFGELNDISTTYNSAMDRLETVRQENRTLAERLLQVQENERQMLAQELHDELGQSISGIKVMCVSMSATATADNQSKLKLVTDICDHLYTVVRELMRELRPTVLDELGLKTALEEIVETWQQRHPGMEIILNCDNSVDACSDTLRINLYRIVQESLTNIVKYAQAQHVTISLTESFNRSKPWIANTFVHLDIVDDGKGFDTTAKRLGFGLIGIRERVNSMAGSMQLNSALEQGTSISIQIPNRKHESNKDATE